MSQIFVRRWDVAVPSTSDNIFFDPMIDDEKIRDSLRLYAYVIYFTFMLYGRECWGSGFGRFISKSQQLSTLQEKIFPSGHPVLSPLEKHNSFVSSSDIPEQM